MLPFVFLALGALLLVSRKASAQSVSPQTPPQLQPLAPPPDAVFVQPPIGYRRAISSEVTPLMQADASISLALPLGTRLLRDGYALGIESHFHSLSSGLFPVGWHKGASVFVPV